MDDYWKNLCGFGVMCFLISIGIGGCCLLISLADKIK
jgi:hypothetical protein